MLPTLPANSSQQQAFICTICGETLNEKGPHISCFSFGKLFSPGEKTIDQKILLRLEFPGCETGRRRFDTTKILGTPCGHLFHSGCIREWFFVKRMCPRGSTCPFCNQRIRLKNCTVVYPSIEGDPSIKDLIKKKKPKLCSRGMNTIKTSSRLIAASKAGIEFVPRKRPGTLNLKKSKQTIFVAFFFFIIALVINFSNRPHIILEGFGWEESYEEDDESIAQNEEYPFFGDTWAFVIMSSCGLALSYDYLCQ